MSKTLTERVRNLFVEKFEELGIDYTGLKIGSFTEVGVECKIPTMLIFKNVPKDPDILDAIETAYFSIIDILEVDERYDTRFDFLVITTKTDAFCNEELEEF